jgi:hypothetical protein
VEADFEKRLHGLHTARHEANSLLLKKAINRHKIDGTIVTPASIRFKEGDIVMIRNEAKQKLEATHFGPFRVKAVRPFGTYVLETKQGAVLRHLVHGSRMLPFIPSGTEKSMIPLMTAKLRSELEARGEPLREVTADVVTELDKTPPTEPTYMDLTLMSRKEWEERDAKRDWRRGKVGEDIQDIAQTALAARRVREQAKAKKERDLSGRRQNSVPNKPDVALDRSATEAVEEPTAQPTLPGEDTLQVQQEQERERDLERRAEEREIRHEERRIEHEKREQKVKAGRKPAATEIAETSQKGAPAEARAVPKENATRIRNGGTYSLRKNPARKEKR